MQHFLVVVYSLTQFRTEAFVSSLTSAPNVLLLAQAHDLASEGFRLRGALADWNVAASLVTHLTPEMLLATTYHAASSIYLSGNYDYELQHWSKMGIIVPILPADDVAIFFDTIIRSTRLALKTTSLSAVLFMFPLRVAGARAHTKSQQDAVASLLEEVRRRFIVADAFLGDLRRLWASR